MTHPSSVTKFRGFAATLLAAFAMAGCGSSSSDDAPNATPADAEAVPASAFDSNQSFVDFLKSSKASEDAEPLRVLEPIPPANDTAEPAAIG